jgi:hypothetical protein
MGEKKTEKILDITFSDKKIEKVLNRFEYYRHRLIGREPLWNHGNKMTLDLKMTVNLAADILWCPSERHHCYLYAPAPIIDLIYVENERIFTSNSFRWFLRSPIFILLESPMIEHWHLIGSGNLYLCDVSQPAIKVQLSGSGNIFMSGSVDELEIKSEGTGAVNTRNLNQNKTLVDLYGYSEVTIAPTRSAHLSLTGKGGDIKLFRKPDELLIRKNEGGGICLVNSLAL